MTKAARPRPTSGEAPFEIDEIFFSRTDVRGVIAAANDIFCRIADYELDALIGAPHKIIRHPDMPKGVFHLMWDRIKQGQTVGAYVRNRARDGLSYWVFAVVAPVEGGYLSTRIKPTGPTLETISALYADLRAREGAGRLSPEESAAALVEALAPLGHRTYDQFMYAALDAETAARDKALGRIAEARRTALGDLAKAMLVMKSGTEALGSQFRSIRGVPTNLRIAAVRLGDAGLPLIAISENYSLMCRDIWHHLDTVSSSNHGGFESLAAQIFEARFLLTTAQLQEETATAFDPSHLTDNQAEGHVEARRLVETARKTRRDALERVAHVTARVTEIARAFEELKRLVSGLDMTRVLCRVESGRLATSQGEALGGIIAHLDGFHSAVGGRLKDLDAHARDVQRIGTTLSENGDRTRRSAGLAATA